MSKISLGTANGKNVGFDLDLLMRTRLLIQADSGGGKSWVIRRLAEQMFGKVQVILIDPEGEFATLREKFDFVLVGKGGETPADPRSAGLVARRLLELRASAVCDLYELKFSQRHEWVKRFLDEMIEVPKNLWRPVVVIVDEAHAFCPEHGKGESVALGSMIDLATKGRKRGYCAVLATQALGKLNKDASGMLQNRLIGPTFEDLNRKRAAETLGIEPSKPTREFYEEIKLLEPGNFFALGRAISIERIKVHVGSIATTHPEMGSAKHSAPAPPPPEKIKALLPKLADLPKEAEEKARTEAEFRAEIRSLKQQLAEASKSSLQTLHSLQKSPASLSEGSEIRRSLANVNSTLKSFKQLTALHSRRAMTTIDKAGVQVRESLEAVIVSIRKIAEAADLVAADAPAFPPTAPERARGETARLRPVPIPSAVPYPKPQPAGSNGGSPRIGRLHEQVAGILAAYHPEPIESDLLAAMVGRTPGGSWSARLSELNTAGLARVDRGLVSATDECVAQFRGRFNPPTTTEEVRAIWDPKLSEVHRQMLDYLTGQAGEPVTTDALAAAVGRTPGGSFSARISELRTKGLITDHGRALISANKKALFLE